MGTDRKYLVAVFLLVVLAVAFGVFGTVAPPLAEEGSPVQRAHSVVNLNDIVLSRWKQLDTLYTRYFDSNGTLVDLYDISRRWAGDPSNITLSQVCGIYALGLLNMYEQTGTTYYLSKLRSFVDAINRSSLTISYTPDRNGNWIHFFYPVKFYYDGAERDDSPIQIGWLGWLTLRLWQLTGNTNYLNIAKRLAHESYDHFAVIHNSTDTAFSAGYYTGLTEDQCVCWNRNTMIISFYLLYGKTVNASFTAYAQRILHWTKRGQLTSGTYSGLFPYSGYGEGNVISNVYLYSALTIYEWMRGQTIDSGVYASEYTTSIQNCLIALQEVRTYDCFLDCMNPTALNLGLKLGYTVNVQEYQTEAYLHLTFYNYTQYGGLPTWGVHALGWRWAEFWGLFSTYPLSNPYFNTANMEKIVDYTGTPLSYAIAEKYRTCSWDYCFGNNGYYGQGESLFSGTGYVYHIVFNPTDDCDTFSVVNGTYYVNATYSWTEGNVLKQYLYPDGFNIYDVSGTLPLRLFEDNPVSDYYLWVENGTKYTLSSLSSGAYKFSDSIFLQHKTSTYKTIYLYSPKTTWSLTQAYGVLQTIITNSRVFSSSYYYPFLGGSLQEMAMLNALKNCFTTPLLTASMPLPLESILAIEANTKNRWAEAKWGVNSFNDVYTAAVYSNSEPALLMHNKPQQVSLTSWAYDSSTRRLTFTVNVNTEVQSSTKIYCGSIGPPTSVSGATSWSYDSTLNVLIVNQTHLSPAKILVYWKFPGDIDGDNDVDANDLYLLAAVYGSHVGDPSYNSTSDIDWDGDIDADDLHMFAENYGKH